jgi:hypothetical protein
MTKKPMSRDDWRDIRPKCVRWTWERKDWFRRLWETGVSCSELAREFGVEERGEAYVLSIAYAIGCPARAAGWDAGDNPLFQRRCPKCEQMLPLSAFWPSTRNSGGRCKECASRISRERREDPVWWGENAPKIAARRREAARVAKRGTDSECHPHYAGTAKDKDISRTFGAHFSVPRGNTSNDRTLSMYGDKLQSTTTIVVRWSVLAVKFWQMTRLGCGGLRIFGLVMRRHPER